MNPQDNRCRTAQRTCTLRAAIEQSNATPGSNVIDLPAGDYVLDSKFGELVIENNLTIRGAGAGTLASDGSIVPGSGTVIGFPDPTDEFDFSTGRVLSIGGGDLSGPGLSGIRVTIRGVTIQNGATFNGGGGIRIFEGSTLILGRSIVTKNRVGPSDAFGYGGGIYNQGALQVIESTITHNKGFEGSRGGVASPITEASSHWREAPLTAI